MKRILVTTLVLLSIIALIQFSPNLNIPQVSATAAGPLKSVTLTFNPPSNSTTAIGAYQTILVKVVTQSPYPTYDVSINLNGTSLGGCGPSLNVSIVGLLTCHYQIENVANTTKTYSFKATATAGGSSPGTLDSGTFYLTAGPMVVQIPLVSGWNLISLPIVPASTAIKTVLASQIAGGNFSIVWSYQGGAWKSATLNPITHVLSGPLTIIQDGLGYWIYMTKADNLFVVGNVFAPPPALPPSYSLSAAWNLIGFKPQPNIDVPPSTTTETVATYLLSINAFYDHNNVWIYTNSNGQWSRAQQTDLLYPGTGLWIYLSAAKTLYP